MNKQQDSIEKKLTSNKAGLTLFIVFALITVGALIAPAGVLSVPAQGTGGQPVFPLHFNNTSGPVKLNGKLSQTKLIQNSEGLIYLDVSIEAPALPNVKLNDAATDLIVVLDSSGSMGAANKMPYAKAAIANVLSQLREKDRFALVSFANSATLWSPLVSVTAASKQHLTRVIDSISANGGTNLGEGLLHAMGVLKSDHNRVSKILLLSDGEANQGITNPQQLAGLAAQFKHHESILSTIGMGLGFNETLMASLADHGMGNYSYLANLSGLNSILAKDLRDSRKVFANASELVVRLNDGVRLLDAGGYPIVAGNDDSSTVKISTGQLLDSEVKRLVMTFAVPTQNVTQIATSNIELIYHHRGEKQHVVMSDESLRVAILEPAKKPEALASVNKEVYRTTWLNNNLGRLKRKLSQWVREGNKQEAEAVIRDYRESVSSAEAASQIRLRTADFDDELDQLNKKVDQAFTGKPIEQKDKQNRAAKSLLSESINEQRSQLHH